MKTIERTLLKFSELSPDQKAKAIEKNRHWNVGDEFWYEHIIEDAKRMFEFIGLEISKIYFRGFCSQGDGACFESRIGWRRGGVQELIQEAPKDTELHRLANEYRLLQAQGFYGVYGGTRHRGHYYHEYSMDVDAESERGKVDESDWKELMADVARWIYKRLETEYEYQTSDESVGESLKANEVEFEVDEDGELVF